MRTYGTGFGPVSVFLYRIELNASFPMGAADAWQATQPEPCSAPQSHGLHGGVRVNECAHVCLTLTYTEPEHQAQENYCWWMDEPRSAPRSSGGCLKSVNGRRKAPIHARRHLGTTLY
jgi:hypothetical protein